jgi:hypothetical protein
VNTLVVAPNCLFGAGTYLLRMKQLWVTRLAAAAGLAPQRALSQGGLSAVVERGCNDTPAFGNDNEHWSGGLTQAEINSG